MSARSQPAPGGPRERPGLRLVRRRSRGLMKRNPATRLAPVIVLASICAAALVVAVLLEQVTLAQSAFKLSRIRREMVAAEETNQALLLRMTQLSNPARIERYARTRLGLVEPTSVDYLVADLGRLDRGVAVLRPHRGGAIEGRAAGAAP